MVVLVRVGRRARFGEEIPGRPLLDLALEVLAGYQVRDVVVVGIGVLSVLGHVLVALGQLPKRGEGVGAQLVQNAGHELRKLLVLAITVDGKRVGGDSGVHWATRKGGLAKGCPCVPISQCLEMSKRYDGVFFRLTLRGREVNDVSVALEHVDLLDSLDGLGVQLLQGGLELLVVVGVPGDIALLLVSRGTLATCDCLFGLVIWSS